MKKGKIAVLKGKTLTLQFALFSAAGSLEE